MTEKLPVGTKVAGAGDKHDVGTKIEGGTTQKLPAGARVQRPGDAPPTPQPGAVLLAIVNKSTKFSNDQIAKHVAGLKDSRVAFFASGPIPTGARVIEVRDSTDLKKIY